MTYKDPVVAKEKALERSRRYRAKKAELEATISAHREAFAWLYQFADAVGTFIGVLDNLSALAAGRAAPHPWEYPAGTPARLQALEDAARKAVMALESGLADVREALSALRAALPPTAGMLISAIERANEERAIIAKALLRAAENRGCYWAADNNPPAEATEYAVYNGAEMRAAGTTMSLVGDAVSRCEMPIVLWR